jgi:1-acyl-sn-glycerol-3-phosphate acyltransferase
LVLVRPFSEKAYFGLVQLVQGSWLHNMVFLVENILGCRFRFTGEVPPEEPAIVTGNHLSHDWLAVYSLSARLPNGLANVRVVLKKATQYFPVLGWGMKIGYWPFVSRNFERDQRYLADLFGKFKRFNFGILLWIFPEGTRRTKSKLAASIAYAKEKGLPQWNHVMIPRHRGLHIALRSMEGVCKVIHDVTLQYSGWPNEDPPGLWGVLNTDPRTPHVIHVNLKRVPISEIGREEEDVKNWLMKSFAEKERLLDEYQRGRQFPGKNLLPPVPAHRMAKHIVFWALASAAVYGKLFFL